MSQSASAPPRSDRIDRVPVVAYCRDAARLGALEELLRRNALTTLVETTSSLARLAEIAQRLGRLVVVARVERTEPELEELLAHCEGLPLVLLTPQARRVALQVLRSGASAVLGGETDESQLGAAVLSATHGLLTLPADSAPALEPEVALTVPPEPLTPREMEILHLLAGGDSNKTIATRLGISVHTVKFHVSSILAKLGVSSRTEAVALGLRLGFVLL
jgi:two-component system, NarL family, response regulator YdfI